MIEDECKQGNLKAILKYRAKGDEYLRSIIEGSEKINKYISPKIQNEIIDVCNSIIIRKIVENVNASKCFTVLADETSDISTSEQLSICVRYIGNENKLHEEFLQFFVVESLSGVDLASSILNGSVFFLLQLYVLVN